MEKATLEQIFGDFNRSSVRYLVVGGLAVVAHGYVRLTHDVDIVLDLEMENIKRAMDVLTGLNYYPRVPVQAVDFSDERNRREWIENKGMVVFSMISDVHRDTVVDLFAKEPFDFDEEYRNAVVFDLNGIGVPIIRKNTLLEMKKKAGRPKDLLDISCLTTQEQASPS
ncbi:MAG: hypothetical protein PHP44_02890 [Kiritimatiellae bacterium]|nr:hypothetical protein [Kiritimatiellia bacterium]MDD4735034.1 hypothetical protein [Kiritimatiellia bacterium]